MHIDFYKNRYDSCERESKLIAYLKIDHSSWPKFKKKIPIKYRLEFLFLEKNRLSNRINDPVLKFYFKKYIF